MNGFIPKWRRELAIFRRVKSVLIPEGNMLDLNRDPHTGEAMGHGACLHDFLRNCGYHNLVFYNNRRGFSNVYEEHCARNFARLMGTSEHQPSERSAFNGVSCAAFAPQKQRIARRCVILCHRQASVVFLLIWSAVWSKRKFAGMGSDAKEAMRKGNGRQMGRRKQRNGGRNHRRYSTSVFRNENKSIILYVIL